MMCYRFYRMFFFFKWIAFRGSILTGLVIFTERGALKALLKKITKSFLTIEMLSVGGSVCGALVYRPKGI